MMLRWPKTGAKGRLGGLPAKSRAGVAVALTAPPKTATPIEEQSPEFAVGWQDRTATERIFQ